MTRFIRAGLVIMAFWLAIPYSAQAQEEDESTTFPLKNFYAEIKHRPRSIFRNFKFGFSTGYGHSYLAHTLGGYSVYQPIGDKPQLFATKTKGDPQILNWYNYPETRSGALPAGADTLSGVGFKGGAMNIPFKLTIHFEIKQKFRIGGGYSYEFMSLGSMKPTAFSDRVASYQPGTRSGWMNKYFVHAGYSFYRTGNYLFTGDAQIGAFNPGANFSTAIQKSIYVNLGVTIERELSEYLRVFVRPSFEIKSFTLPMPGGAPSIKNNLNAAYLNIGFTYSIPELPKCKKHDCKIQMNHAHGDREYRSRVHPIYKKQNPLYGENHPKLFRYKGKNKKKLNPY